MSEPIKIQSHYEEGRDLLPSQFYEKPYINAHLKAMLDGCQDVEDSFYQFLYTNKLYKTALGENLSVIGRLFDTERILGEDDVNLRRRINAEILRRNSEGTPNSVKKLMEAYTGLGNMRIFEHTTGGVVLFGETSDSTFRLTGEESSYLKSACPVTTGSCVLGVSYSDQYSNTFIPAELDLSYYNLNVEDDSELKNLVTGAGSSANIIVRGENVTFDLTNRNAQLSEFTTTDADLSVETGEGITDTLSVGASGDYLGVSFEGFENDRAILIDSTQITINSTVTQIIDAFNEVAP